MNAFNQLHDTKRRCGTNDNFEPRRLNQPPELFMPAMPPLGLITAMEKWIAARFRQWQRRRKRAHHTRELLNLDDHILVDLGLNRADLMRASRRLDEGSGSEHDVTEAPRS